MPYLGADHGGALGDAAQGLAQVAAAAHKRHLEVVLVDVVDLVSGGQHLHERGEGGWVSIAEGRRQTLQQRRVAGSEAACPSPLQSTGSSPRIEEDCKLSGDQGATHLAGVELFAGTVHVRELKWFREHHN